MPAKKRNSSLSPRVAGTKRTVSQSKARSRSPQQPATRTLASTNSLSSNDSGEDKFELAMEFKLNARSTSFDDRDNTRWLLEAGYAEEEITDELKQRFKKRYSYLYTKFINHNPVPEEEQPWHHHWIRKLEVTPELLQFLPNVLGLFPSSREDELYSTFERIGKTSIKQRQLPRSPNGKIKHKAVINSVFDHWIAFFKDSGLPRDFGFDLDKTIVHLLYTDDDSDKNFQDPHTDYPYVITRRNMKDRVRLSWTAHMPLTEEGSWITIWWGPGVGYTLQIPFGKILLLRSDVIHGGGIPNVTRRTDKKQFRRIHFYLVTPDQAATPGLIYEYNYDNETRLIDTCYQAKRTFSKSV
jgi:hypothetical protein